MISKKEIKEFFNNHAAVWDENSQVNSENIEIILNYAKVSSSKSILDIACGTGVMFDYYLAKEVSCITGIDISGEMIKLARDKYVDFKNINLITADAEEFKFEKEHDCCIIFNAFPHFCNPEKIIKNLFNAVKSGGTITIAHDRSKAEIDKHHSGEARHISNGLMPAEELAKLLNVCGFEEINYISNEDIYIVTGSKPIK